jgi:hypothetical protein
MKHASPMLQQRASHTSWRMCGQSKDGHVNTLIIASASVSASRYPHLQSMQHHTLRTSGLYAVKHEWYAVPQTQLLQRRLNFDAPKYSTSLDTGYLDRILHSDHGARTEAAALQKSRDPFMDQPTPPLLLILPT